jgi:hypothetical protein
MKTKSLADYPLRVESAGAKKPVTHAAKASSMNGKETRTTACGRILQDYSASIFEHVNCAQCLKRLR